MDSAGPRRTLVLRFHSLGDVVLTTGVVRALAAHVGGALEGVPRGGTEDTVEVATDPQYVSLFRGAPWISRVWTRAELGRAAGHAGARRDELGRVMAEDAGARRESVGFFDRVIDLQGTPGARRLAGRLGPARSVRTHALSRRWIVFWGDRFPRPRIPHAIARYAGACGLDPLGTYPPVVAVTPEEDSEAARLAPAVYAAAGGSAIALVHGASRRTKEYPRDQLHRLGRLLAEAGWPVWWLEPPAAERGAVAPPEPGHPPVLRLPLDALKAVLARAALVITSDSGPMHLATAVGTPVLATFGSTVPTFGFTPAGAGDRVLQVDDLACRPCAVHGRRACWLGHWRCLRDLTPERVAEEALRMLRANRNRSCDDTAPPRRESAGRGGGRSNGRNI